MKNLTLNAITAYFRRYFFYLVSDLNQSNMSMDEIEKTIREIIDIELQDLKQASERVDIIKYEKQFKFDR